MRGSKQTPVNKDARLDSAYSIMQSMEGKLGGGEGVQGIYGSITRTGMQRIFDSMKHNCGFGSNSVLVDIGAGLGRPLVHALVNPGIKSGHGIELDEVKVTKADAFIEQTMAELARRGHMSAEAHRPVVHCQSMEEVPSLGAATHAYSFWEGIPLSGREAFGRLFASSTTLKCVAVVQRSIRSVHPTQLMATYGFGPLMLIGNFTVSMSGSGASFQAYIFSKMPSATAAMFSALRTPQEPAPTPTPTPAAQVAGAVAVATVMQPNTGITAQPEEQQEEERGGHASPRARAKQQPITAFSKQRKPTLRPTAPIHKEASKAPVAAGPAGPVQATSKVLLGPETVAAPARRASARLSRAANEKA